MDFSTLCRCCLEEFSKDNPMCSNKTIMELYLFCIQLNYESLQGEEVPKYFCLKCRDRIKSAYLFIRHAKRCNEKLQKIILQNRALTIPDLDNENIDCISDIEINTDTNIYNSTQNLTLRDDEETNPVTAEDYQRFIIDQENFNLCASNSYSSGTLQNYMGDVENIDETQFLKTVPKLDKSINNNGNQIDITSGNQLSKQCIEPTINHISIHVDEQKDSQKDSLFICDVCDKQFTKRQYLIDHLAIHSDQRPFKCNLCQKTFKRKKSVWSHMRTHKIQQTGEKPYVCDVCNKRFTSRGSLNIHASSHSEHRSRPYSCNLCDKSFAREQQLNRHRDTHSGEYPVLCTVCGKRFRNERYLSEHMRRHTGVKSHACGLCEYRAAYISSLRRHEATHTNTRRHQCPHCQKKFNGRTGLVRHIRTHTGEKPIQCPSCPLKFGDHWKRKTHIMRVHKVPFDQIPRLSADGQPIID